MQITDEQWADIALLQKLACICHQRTGMSCTVTVTFTEIGCIWEAYAYDRGAGCRKVGGWSGYLGTGSEWKPGLTLLEAMERLADWIDRNAKDRVEASSG